MDNIEIILIDLSEETTKRLAEKHKPQGLEQNKEIARMGGHAAKVARDDIEKNLGKSVISKTNALSYKYLDTNKLDKNELLKNVQSAQKTVDYMIGKYEELFAERV